MQAPTDTARPRTAGGKISYDALSVTVCESGLRVQQFHGPQNRPAHYFQAVSRKLVHRVGIGMVELAHRIEPRRHASVHRVHYIYRRDPRLQEWNMVVDDPRFIAKEIIAVAKLFCGHCDVDRKSTRLNSSH